MSKLFGALGTAALALAVTGCEIPITFTITSSSISSSEPAPTPSATSTQGAPSSSAGKVLFQEEFEDTAIASRGWYDATDVLLASAAATSQLQGSTHAVEFDFKQGATTPSRGKALRHLFSPSSSVYLSYYVKYSSNWVGSEKPYHPHEFLFMTNLEDSWAGPSFTHLTAYVEQNGGTPLLALQDGKNIDQNEIGKDLTSVTEDRGVNGCNGDPEGLPEDCYKNGDGLYVNGKTLRASTATFTNDPSSSGYKANWHHVEAYFQLNSIGQDGKARRDGVMRYWFDGKLLLERDDVYMRTGAHPDMKFNQLLVAPYIGDGSPIDQSMWVDRVTVATAPVSAGAAPTPTPSTSPAANTITLQAEDMPTKNASANRAVEGGWALLSAGYLEQTVEFPITGRYDFDLIARASLAQGVGAQAEIRIDQVKVASTLVSSTSYASYPMSAEVSAGSHRVAIAFTNDYYDSSAGQDRNLYVDQLTITPEGEGSATPTPTPTPTQTSTGSSGGGGGVAFADEPAGMTVLRDNGWPVLVPPDWILVNPNGLLSIVTDPTAPFSPQNTVNFLYPKGFTGMGNGPGMVTTLLGGKKEAYVGFWWKANAEWQGHPSNVNKIAFLFPNDDGSGQDFIYMKGSPGGPYQILVESEFNGIGSYIRQANRGNVTIVPGNWYRIEWYEKLESSAGAHDGIIRWWVNGTQIGDYTGIAMPGLQMVELKFSPTWGGVDQTVTKLHDDYFRFGPVRVLTR